MTTHSVATLSPAKPKSKNKSHQQQQKKKKKRKTPPRIEDIRLARYIKGMMDPRLRRTYPDLADKCNVSSEVFAHLAHGIAVLFERTLLPGLARATDVANKSTVTTDMLLTLLRANFSDPDYVREVDDAQKAAVARYHASHTQ